MIRERSPHLSALTIEAVAPKTAVRGHEAARRSRDGPFP
jgi:hypothetical protein